MPFRKMFSPENLEGKDSGTVSIKSSDLLLMSADERMEFEDSVREALKNENIVITVYSNEINDVIHIHWERKKPEEHEPPAETTSSP